MLDVHNGFPCSTVDVLQNYVGNPNSLRLPAFMACDLKLSKDFRISFLPWLRNQTLRGALGVHNPTDHLNPSDVYNNVASPFFGNFAGPQHRVFDAFLDVLYRGSRLGRWQSRFETLTLGRTINLRNSR